MIDHEVRRVRPEDWAAVRDLRLAALRTDPMAFGSTLEREQAYPAERWQERARSSSSGDQQATFVATAPDGQLVGMATILRQPAGAGLFGMWVHPSRRGTGLGGRLLDTALRWLREIEPTATVTLEVNRQQGAAVGLYRSRGFEFSGHEQPLGHDPPAVAHEMVLRAPVARP